MRRLFSVPRFVRNTDLEVDLGQLEAAVAQALDLSAASAEEQRAQRYQMQHASSDGV